VGYVLQWYTWSEADQTRTLAESPGSLSDLSFSEAPGRTLCGPKALRTPHFDVEGLCGTRFEQVCHRKPKVRQAARETPNRLLTILSSKGQMKSFDHKRWSDEADDVSGGVRIREVWTFDAQGQVSGEDGRPDAVGGILRFDRTALPEGWQ
jgi:hypothetical protein